MSIAARWSQEFSRRIYHFHIIYPSRELVFQMAIVFVEGLWSLTSNNLCEYTETQTKTYFVCMMVAILFKFRFWILQLLFHNLWNLKSQILLCTLIFKYLKLFPSSILSIWSSVPCRYLNIKSINFKDQLLFLSTFSFP